MQDKGLRSHCSGSVQCHLAKAGTALLPGLSGSQLPEAVGTGCFLGTGCSCVLPVGQQLFGEAHPESAAEGRGHQGHVHAQVEEAPVLSVEAGWSQRFRAAQPCWDELSRALPYPHCKRGDGNSPQCFPLKPSQPARPRFRHSPCKTPGKSAK